MASLACGPEVSESRIQEIHKLLEQAKKRFGLPICFQYTTDTFQAWPGSNNHPYWKTISNVQAPR